MDSNALVTSQTPGFEKDLKATPFLPHLLEKLPVQSLAGGHPPLGSVLEASPFEKAHYSLS